MMKKQNLTKRETKKGPKGLRLALVMGMLLPVVLTNSSTNFYAQEQQTSQEETVGSEKQTEEKEKDVKPADVKPTTESTEQEVEGSEKEKKSKENKTIVAEGTKNYDNLEIARETVVAIPRGDVSKDRVKERRGFDHSPLETTGIFLPRGKELKITVNEEVETLYVVIGQYGVYGNLNSEEEKREPISYPLKKGENIISRPDSDGMVYMENQSYSQTVTVDIEGGVKVPRFVLGQKNSAETFAEEAEKLKDHVPFFEIEGNYTFGTFQMSQLDYLDYTNKERLPELLSYWDQVVKWTNEFYGFNTGAVYAAAKYLPQRIHITNPDTGAGYASATSRRISFQIDTGASKDILSTDGLWGLWHEIGHTYQTPQYKFEGMGEVTVNLSANYIKKKMGLGDRTADVKEKVAEYLSRPKEERNYLLVDNLFVKLSMLWTLQRVFGDEFYALVSQEYRSMTENELPSDETEDRIQKMIRTFSKVANRNLAPYFDEWGLDITNETWEICNKLPKLEKDIWLDIAGFDDRYELPGVLPKYTVPTGTILKKLPIFTKEITIDGLKSVPLPNDVVEKKAIYTDIGKTSLMVKLTNQSGISNLILNDAEVTGGDAVKFRGNAYGYQIMAPDSETKTFVIAGKNGNLHQTWGEKEYISVTQYDSRLKEVKQSVSVNGSGAGSDSKLVAEKFQGASYELGDYIKITHAESKSRLDRYKNNELLEKDSEKIYWYKMTDKGWEEAPVKLIVEPKKDIKAIFPQVLKASDLVTVETAGDATVTEISYTKPMNMAVLGKQVVNVSVKDSLGNNVSVDVSLELLGGNAVKLGGKGSIYQILAPDPETKTFFVSGKEGILNQTWGEKEYISVTQYDSRLKEIKQSVRVNGNTDSKVLGEKFQGASYELGDYVKITHEEAKTRLDRYKNNELLEKDSEKIYWYKMTDKGWEEAPVKPVVVAKKDVKVVFPQVPKASDLVTVETFGDATVTEISYTKPMNMAVLGKQVVSVSVKDSLGNNVSVDVSLELLGGNAVKFRGNAYGYQIMAPDSETKTFVIAGENGNLHQTWGEKEYISVTQYDSRLKEVKQSVSVNGSGAGSDSKLVAEKFQGASYELGDYIKITHAESKSRLDRYKNNELLEKDSEKIYWYKMTDKGWEEAPVKPVVVAKKDVKVVFPQVPKASDLVTVETAGDATVTEISYTKPMNMAVLGKQVVNVSVKDSLGNNVSVDVSLELLGGNAVNFRGWGLAYQILAPDPETKTFVVAGKNGNLHDRYEDEEYISVTQYDSRLKEIKQSVSVNGNVDSKVLGEKFQGVNYELGDYVKITHAESKSRLDRYKNNELLEKDSEKIYWYKMTDKGWEEAPVKLIVEPKKDVKVIFPQMPKASDLVTVETFGDATVTEIVYTKSIDTAVLGAQVVNVSVKDSLGNNVSVDVSLELLGGNAVKLGGKGSIYQILAPDPETKTFFVSGKEGILNQTWGEKEYISVTQYDSRLKEIKQSVRVNGNTDSKVLGEKFQGASYELGDYVKITHEEAKTRLDRYKNNELLEKDSEKIYWYKMTDKGWEEAPVKPVVVAKKDVKVVFPQVPKASDLVTVETAGDATVTEISYTKPINMAVLGKQVVSVSVKDSLGNNVSVDVSLELLGGNAVNFRGWVSAYQILAPDPETKTFVVAGKNGNLHDRYEDEEYISVTQYDSRLKEIKQSVSVNGNVDSKVLGEKFQGVNYELGDYVKITHEEPKTRLDRYKNNELLEKDSEKIYWYKMTKQGWAMLEEEPSTMMNHSFKRGYWKEYGLILNGQVEVDGMDMGNKNAVSKTLDLLNEKGEVTVSVPTVNTDWYSPGEYAGYQAILSEKVFSTVGSGEYKLQMSVTVGDETVTIPYMIEAVGYGIQDYQDTFLSISTNNVGIKTIEPMSRDGQAVLKVVVPDKPIMGLISEGLTENGVGRYVNGYILNTNFDFNQTHQKNVIIEDKSGKVVKELKNIHTWDLTNWNIGISGLQMKSGFQVIIPKEYLNTSLYHYKLEVRIEGAEKPVMEVQLDKII
ncbi:putative mucin/carbohydrate-binding domain-containing protein [Enterococcus faecalis]|uniref:putative mucin/carbohydrate-binding domain-containing protein n=1 Tax=Enterococcus faecalis TaxID=1351 RepID=UPI0025AFCDD5|nr:putative mucin/carbohydrate-binding domain-containing protein [Enterococcus faecalis]MDN3185243.1 putative mucin/carbohydrate-binding domain-containing protein [Enterococcus faecalis]